MGKLKAILHEVLATTAFFCLMALVILVVIMRFEPGLAAKLEPLMIPLVCVVCSCALIIIIFFRDNNNTPNTQAR